MVLYLVPKYISGLTQDVNLIVILKISFYGILPSFSLIRVVYQTLYRQIMLKA